ncbi:MAG: hypothetical protein ACP5PQ_06660 [Thermoproteota archaeon]
MAAHVQVFLTLAFLLASFTCLSVFSQPVQPSSTLIYTRANGRIGDITLTSSGGLLFTNYPTKPGRVWCLTKGFETQVYEASKAAYDLYGVAASKNSDVYVYCPYTGEVPCIFIVFKNA